MELKEILLRRAKVQQFIDSVPYYATQDFIVKTLDDDDAKKKSFTYLSNSRNVAAYRTIKQAIGMVMDIPISYQKENNPYVQGMHVVYDTQLAFPYPWYQYNTKKIGAASTTYVVPPDTGYHVIPNNYILFTIKDIASLIKICVNAMADDKGYAAGIPLWLIQDADEILVPTRNKTIAVYLIKTDGYPDDAGEFDMVLIYQNVAGSGEEITPLFHLSMTGGITDGATKEGALGQSGTWPASFKWSNANDKTLTANESSLAIIMQPNCKFWIQGDSKAYQQGFYDETLVLGTLYPSTDAPIPPNPDEVYDLWFVRPSGIIARESGIGELMDYNTSSPFVRDEEKDPDLPATTDPDVVYAEQWTIPPDTNSHAVPMTNNRGLIGFGVTQEYPILIALVMAAADMSQGVENLGAASTIRISFGVTNTWEDETQVQPNNLVLWEIRDDNSDPPRWVKMIARKSIPREPQDVGASTIGIFMTVDVAQDLSDYTIYFESQEGVMTDITETLQFEAMFLNESVNPSVLSPDAYIKVRITDITEPSKKGGLKLMFHQRKVLRTNLVSEPDVLAAFPPMEVTWPLPPDPDVTYPITWPKNVMSVSFLKEVSDILLTSYGAFFGQESMILIVMENTSATYPFTMWFSIDEIELDKVFEYRINYFSPNEDLYQYVYLYGYDVDRGFYYNTAGLDQVMGTNNAVRIYWTWNTETISGQTYVVEPVGFSITVSRTQTPNTNYGIYATYVNPYLTVAEVAEIFYVTF